MRLLNILYDTCIEVSSAILLLSHSDNMQTVSKIIEHCLVYLLHKQYTNIGTIYNILTLSIFYIQSPLHFI